MKSFQEHMDEQIALEEGILRTGAIASIGASPDGKVMRRFALIGKGSKHCDAGKLTRRWMNA